MSWRQQPRTASAWRQAVGHLRQEYSSAGAVSHVNLSAGLEALRSTPADVSEQELVEDLSFLVQQLIGSLPSPHSPRRASGVLGGADPAAVSSLCRLLSSLAASRGLKLHARAAILILGALRHWSDTAAYSYPAPASPRSSSTSLSEQHSAPPSGDGASSISSNSTSEACSGAQQDALSALAVLLPDHLPQLPQHERVAQLAALQSLVCATPRTQHTFAPAAPSASSPLGSTAPPPPPTLEAQCLALQALAACCERTTPASSSTSSGAASGPNPTVGAASPCGLTQEEAEGVLATVCALLHAVACRGRPVEDAAHSRLYTALLRALQAAMGASRQAWVPRAAGVVEGLQRLLTYGAAASAAASSAAGAAAAAAAATAGSSGEGAGPAGLAAAADGGRRYRPPHLRRRESDASGVMSDSDAGSDTEGPGSGPGPGAGAGTAGGVVVDRHRSSRVRLGALGVVQAMARGEPKAMQLHWTTLMPLQAPLAPRPLSPHLLTVLLHDPMTKVRALAAATISSLLEGPAPRAILAVAEARTATSRAPVRGFLTLSLSLGQLLLALHTGLLAAVSREPAALALPAVLRALVVLVGATPYERLPPELLPQIISTLRARWASLHSPSSSASSSSSLSHPAPAISPAELAPIQAAYLACLAECFSTKQPIPGLAAHLQGPEGGAAAAHMLAELLALGRDPGQPAVVRIEALGALRGLAAHYAFVMPADAWDDIVATAAVGLSPPQPPTSPRGAALQRSPSRGNTASANNSTGANNSLSRSTSSSSLQQSSWRSVGAGNAHQHQQQQQQQHPGSTQGQGQAVGSASNTPEDKAAQLSVKLVSDFLASAARQLGLCSGEAAGADGEGGAGPVPPPSPCVVPLAAAGARQQAASAALLSPASITSEEEREAGLRRLGRLWQEAFGLLVPAATGHSSYMVRSAGLTCLGEVPAAAFAALPPALQHQLLQLLAAAAAEDAVAAVRAAACKALGAAAALPAALDDPGLGAAVSSALQACTRDTVLSVRMAAAWAVANLCDAYRVRMAAGVVLEGKAHGGGSGAEEGAGAGRGNSHAQASTSDVAWSPAGKAGRKGHTSGRRDDKDGPAPNGGGAAAAGDAREGSSTGAALQPHHYQQLAALCTAAVAATQDTEKVRANGIRAVGNLLACLTPALAPNLAGTTTTTSTATHHTRSSTAAPWGSPARAAGRGAGPSTAKGPPSAAEPAATEQPAAATTMDLDTWLDSALGCLQSCLTTGNMKVQWNACYAAMGLLRNARLRANPRVEARVGPLLLLLVMLVRESANFKIRTHAAAALAALPCRTAYGDVLPDALLVVAAALEGLEGGSRAGPGNAPSSAPPGAPGAKRDAQGVGEEEGEGGDGRFPNFRYAAGLSAQLKATLVHLLALAEAGDARRVREALVRRLDGIHSTLREQLGEAVASLQAAVDAASGVVALPSGSPGEDVGPAWAGRSSSGSVGAVGKGVELPSDPFGLEGGSGRSGGASPHGAGGAKQGLVGALRGLSLRELCEPPADMHTGGAVGAVSPTMAKSPSPRPCLGVVSNGGSAEGSKHGLVVQVPSASCVGAGEDAGVRQARRRLGALRGALSGFAALLPQLGPAGEAVLADVRAALGDAN